MVKRPGTHRRVAPLKVTTVGTPAAGDVRSLAALLVKLDRQPPVKLVESPKEPQCSSSSEPSATE